MHMRADRLLRQNIDAILQARGQTRAQLAAACGLSRSWPSKVFKETADPTEKRGIPLKWLDAFADFFGIDTYQLFQPGISHLTERRIGSERRAVADRRINALPRGLPTTTIRQVQVTPDDELILEDLHALSYEDYQRVKGWIRVARLGGVRGKTPGPRGGPPPAASGTPPPAPVVPAPKTRRRRPPDTPKKK